MESSLGLLQLEGTFIKRILVLLLIYLDDLSFTLNIFDFRVTFSRIIALFYRFAHLMNQFGKI